MDIIVNALLHSFILFVFLTIFYFYYIAPLIQSHLDFELKNAINDSIKTLLNTSSDVRVIHEISGRLKDKYNDEDPFKKDFNFILQRNTYIFLIIFLLSIVLTYYLLTWYGYKISLKFIILENILLFTIIGMMEFVFFLNVAYKYTVVYPSEIKKQVNDRIKYNLELNNSS